jgi:hypothetical protein
MPQRGLYTLVRKLATVAICGAAVLAANPGVALAYAGPPGPPPSGLVPGGFSCVVTSRTVGPAGALIRSLTLHGLVASLRIRAGTFSVPVQLTITEPYGRGRNCQGGPGIGNAGFRGYRAVGGIGLLVQVGGQTYQGTFAKPLILRLTSALIRRSSLVAAWGGTRFVLGPNTVARPGSAVVRVAANGDFAVLTRDTKLLGPAATLAFRRASAATMAAMPGRGLPAEAFLLAAGAPPPGLGVIAPRWER